MSFVRTASGPCVPTPHLPSHAQSAGRSYLRVPASTLAVDSLLHWPQSRSRRCNWLDAAAIAGEVAEAVEAAEAGAVDVVEA